MSAIRDRTKEQFPMVLLTLLSIVQALALELLWSHVRESDYLLELSWTTINAWIQISTTFLGLVLIWIIFASSAMRFRWVPVTSDSVYPFLIGVLEFTMVEVLGPGESGRWLLVNAVLFGVMVRVSHKTMRRARLDPDNAVFFSNLAPATTRDFIPRIVVVAGMAAAGIYLEINDGDRVFETAALLGTGAVLSWQFYTSTHYWTLSIGRRDGPGGQ